MAFSGAHHLYINEANLYDNSGLNGIQYLAQNIASDATHDSVKGSKRGTCHPGTRANIVQDILNWANSDVVQKKIYWLHGSAGVGKSVIAQTAAVRLEKEGKLGASFFFSRTDPTRNNVSRLFSTIAFKLSISLRSKDLRQAVESQIELDPSVVTQSMEIQWSKLIVKPFKSATTDNKTLPMSVVIIDGLDECEDLEHQLDLLQLLDETELEDLPLRIVVSSRPEAHIRDSILEEKAIKHELLRSSQVDDEIRLFFSDKFKELCKQRKFHAAIQSAGGGWPSNDDLTTLVSKASGQYIYAKTVLRYVELGREGTPVTRLLQIIRLENGHELFSDLDILYRDILSKCPKIAFSVLGFLYIILRETRHILTPTLSVIDQLLNLDAGELEAALDSLHSLVYIPDLSLLSTWDIIEPYFHHASLEDFLTDEQRSREYWLNMENAREQILKCCKRSLDLIFSEDHLHRSIDDKEHYSCNQIGSFYALTKSFELLMNQRNISDGNNILDNTHLLKLENTILKLITALSNSEIAEFSKESMKRQVEKSILLETLLVTGSVISGYYLVMGNRSLLSGIDASKQRLLSNVIDMATCNPHISGDLKRELLTYTKWLIESHGIAPAIYYFHDADAVSWEPSYFFRYRGVHFSRGLFENESLCRIVYFQQTKEPDAVVQNSPHQISVLRHFGHRSLIPLYGIDIVDKCDRYSRDRLILPLMQLSDVGHLSKMTNNSSLSNTERLLVIADVIKVVKHLHNEGIIARDMSPNCVLISGNRRGYLIPYSRYTVYSVRLYTGKYPEKPDDTTGMESSDAMPYLPPELFYSDDDIGNEMSNIYSLAMLIYEILMGHRPYDRKLRRFQVIMDKTIVPAKFPSFPPMNDPCWASNGGLLTTEIADLLVECWNRDPTKRPSLDEIYARMHLGDIEDTRPPDEWPLAARFNDLMHSAQFVTPEAIEDMFAMVREAIFKEGEK